MQYRVFLWTIVLALAAASSGNAWSAEPASSARSARRNSSRRPMSPLGWRGDGTGRYPGDVRPSTGRAASPIAPSPMPAIRPESRNATKSRPTRCRSSSASSRIGSCSALSRPTIRRPTSKSRSSPTKPPIDARRKRQSRRPDLETPPRHDRHPKHALHQRRHLPRLQHRLHLSLWAAEKPGRLRPHVHLFADRRQRAAFDLTAPAGRRRFGSTANPP